jgi:soluble lytic murein transglycosylase-like protein
LFRSALTAMLLGVLVTYQSVFAQSNDAVAFAQTPPQPNDCVTQAANYHGVSSWVLRGIIQVESRFNPQAMNKNNNGTVDMGIAQINSMHLKELAKHGIGPKDLMNACVASYVAAWHLKKQINAYGNTWFAVGAYHSTTKCFNERYASLVWNELRNWRVVEGPKLRAVPLSACDPKAQQAQKSNASTRGSVNLAFDQP